MCPISAVGRRGVWSGVYAWASIRACRPEGSQLTVSTLLSLFNNFNRQTFSSPKLAAPVWQISGSRPLSLEPLRLRLRPPLSCLSPREERLGG